MRRIGWAVAAALALVVSTALTGCQASPATSTCWPGRLTVAPASARPGDVVTVSAAPVACAIAFTDDRWYRLELRYTRWDVVPAVRVRVARDGAFSTTVRVPEGAPPGAPVFAVTAGFSTFCPPGAACAGTTGGLRVVRPGSATPDLRALQRREDAQRTQEGRLVDLGIDRVCLTLDRPWTSPFDVELPAGWRSSGAEVLDADRRVVARVGDYVRIAVGATRTHARVPGCKQDRTIVTAARLQRIRHPAATPPGGRLIVGTDAALTDAAAHGVERTGTLTAHLQGDYLCVSLTERGGRVQQLALPPGTTALPDGTLLDGRDAVIAAPGDPVTALVTAAAPRPVGCSGRGHGLGAARPTRTG